MKIMLVSPYDFTYPSGANNHIIHLAAEYQASGHDIRILAPASPGRPLPAIDGFRALGTPVPIHSNGSTARITLSPTLSRQVKRVLAEERPDVIHLHEPLMPTLPLTVLWQAETRTVGHNEPTSYSSLARLRTQGPQP